MSAKTLENWRELDWDLLDIPQLEHIRSQLLRQCLRLQKQQNNNPGSKRLKRKIGCNRRALEGVVSRISRLRKGPKQSYVQGLALCLALKQEGLDPEVRDLLKRAKKIGSTRISQWLDDYVAYSKRKNDELATS